MDDGQVQYQSRLRTIGAYLDSHRAQAISIIESEDGFTVRYQRDDDDLEGIALEFRFVELDCLQTELEWQRSSSRSVASAGDAPVGYQDFLRVLGYELERVEARFLVLDEVEDSIVLSYLFADPRHGYVWRKRMVQIGPEERQTVVRNARRRRQEDTGFLARLSQGPGRPRRGEEPKPLPKAGWESGEHELYRTVLQVAWTGPGENHVDTDLLLTNRRILLHFQEGGTDKTALDTVQGVSTQTVAGPLLKLYTVDVQRADRNHLSLECRDEAQRAELARQIGAAIGTVSVES